MNTKKVESGSERMQRIRKEAADDFWNHIENLGGKFECEHGCVEKHDPADSYAAGTIIALMERDPCFVLAQMILKLEEDDETPNAAKDLREVYRKHFSSTLVENDLLHYGDGED